MIPNKKSSRLSSGSDATEQFGVSKSSHQVAYIDNLEGPKTKPEDIIIRNPGKHVLSETTNGKSAVEFYPDFLPLEDADRAFACLSEEIPWKENSDRYGPQPRLTAWFGHHPYTYSQLTHDPNEKWHSILGEICQRISSKVGKSFNSVLCNLYRDGHDQVGWHSDDEPSLRDNPYIASISLGEVRLFEMRKKPPPEEKDDYSYSQHIKIHLPHGSLLIMEGATQGFFINFVTLTLMTWITRFARKSPGGNF